jgi:acyl carrier protein
MDHLVRKFDEEFISTIHQFVHVLFTNESTLVEIGLDSLAVLRIVTALAPDPDREIDLSELADLRTVGQFRHWASRQVTP